MPRGAKKLHERPTAFFLGDMLSVPGYTFKQVSVHGQRVIVGTVPLNVLVGPEME